MKSYDRTLSRELRPIYLKVLEKAADHLCVYMRDETHVDALVRVLWSEIGHGAGANVDEVSVVVEEETILKRVAADFKLEVLMSELSTSNSHSELEDVDVGFYVSNQDIREMGSTTIFVTPDDVGAIICMGDSHGIFSAYDPQDYRGALEDILSTSEKYTVEIESWEDVLEKLEATAGSEAVNVFEKMVGACSTLHPAGDGLDVGDLAVLTGAWLGLDQSVVSSWASSIGISSDASITRRRDDFEEQGLIGVGENPGGRGAPSKTLEVSSDVRHEVSTPAEFVEYALEVSAGRV
ncbi:transcriptional regulator TbsP domain-containing protein [Salinibaculum rarum]|uniref:transcriptional regulator TbsP domain-containing protein n=1 Tax=Salinibaculum rarum TaxID=3058903 RepID=UPI00265EC292|nr:DUF5821 family protein [Salinibaculum sp. KK48]